MIVTKNISIRSTLNFAGGHLIWIGTWMVAVACIYQFTPFKFLFIPWLPVSVIGTAVAFYVGFKNNQAYDRLWEARKIWGGIVNSSRAWGSSVKGFISNLFIKEDPKSPQQLKDIIQDLVRTHIAWLYAHRAQLLAPTAWEHVNQHPLVRRKIMAQRKLFGIGLLEDDITNTVLDKYLKPDEADHLIGFRNTATQILDRQAQKLKELREAGVIDDFRHMELQKILNDFYVHQGKNERIKKFPLPRQYANMSFIFVGIFIFILPLGLVGEFAKMGEYGIWLFIPFTTLIAWVYLAMELVGDYSENPFEGLGNDIPMLSLCRVIETDLLEMMGEKDIPPAIEPHNGVLM